ncbi:MAG: type II secretion system F family protein [Roseinatronobacter sp.]
MIDIFSGPMGMIFLAGLASVALLLVALISLFGEDRADPMKKFKRQAGARQNATPHQDQKLRRGSGREIKALDHVAHFLEPENEKELSAARQRMIQAGYLDKNAVRDFAALQFILAVTGLIISFLLVFVIAPERFESPLALGFALVMPMLVGYFGPRRWVEKRIETRKDDILSGFPDALDMMLICVEAGQSLDQAIVRVSREIGPAYPALGEEFAAVGEQVKAGRERAEVLKDLSRRCDIADVTSFVTVLVQAQAYGTSIGEALRVFAAEMRDKRIMRAEEKANLLPTKMTLGTMMFTVPPLLIILIGPSVVGIMTDLGGGSINSGM